MSLKPAQLKDAARVVINDLIANATQVEVAERVNEAADASKVLDLIATANVVVRWPNSRTTGVNDAADAALDV